MIQTEKVIIRKKFKFCQIYNGEVAIATFLNEHLSTFKSQIDYIFT